MHDLFIKIAEAFLRKIADESDEHTSKKSEIKVTNDSVILLTPSHLQFAKYGRGPGKKPPLDNILEFVKGKGIIFEGTDQLGTAFAIQASIEKNGTKNWVPNAPNALQEMVENNLGDYYDELNIELVAVETKKVNDIWERQFPSQVEFKI
mgnify:CR=1 FL=1